MVALYMPAHRNINTQNGNTLALFYKFYALTPGKAPPRIARPAELCLIKFYGYTATMLNIKRILVSAALVATFITTSIAASPVGSWSGRIVFDKAPSIPPNATPEQKKQMQSMLDQIKSYRITLVIKSDKTFNVSAPALAMMPAQKAEGTWTVSGTKLTLKSTKENGKPVTGAQAKPQVLDFSADGKTISSTMPNQGKIVFTRK